MPDGRPRLAILYDKFAIYSPSNHGAIANFLQSAKNLQIDAEIITKEHFNTLNTFNGLFIRDTTHPANYTFEFAVEAKNLGLKVIDSPDAIMRGCNKVWQITSFLQEKIPYPKSWFIVQSNIEFLVNEVTYPCVIKVSDGCFSQGVFLAHTRKEFKTIAHELLKDRGSDRLICQEFIKTDFDWRVTIFNKEILFVCKYFMVDDDWKIVKYDRKGQYIEGNHESVAMEDVPVLVLLAAHKCLPLVDNGLYGIDIKETKDGVYVIEINDNPSIDAGIEDSNDSITIYDRIIGYFK